MLKDDQQVQKFCEAFCSNLRLTVREVADEVGILKMCHEILTENLDMQRVASKSVPHLLTDEQNQRCLEVSQNIFDCVNDDKNILKNITAGDDTWVYSYDVERKPSLQNRSQKCHPDPEKRGKFGQM